MSDDKKSDAANADVVIGVFKLIVAIVLLALLPAILLGGFVFALLWSPMKRHWAVPAIRLALLVAFVFFAHLLFFQSDGGFFGYFTRLDLLTSFVSTFDFGKFQNFLAEHLVSEKAAAAVKETGNFLLLYGFLGLIFGCGFSVAAALRPSDKRGRKRRVSWSRVYNMAHQVGRGVFHPLESLLRWAPHRALEVSIVLSVSIVTLLMFGIFGPLYLWITWFGASLLFTGLIASFESLLKKRSPLWVWAFGIVLVSIGAIYLSRHFLSNAQLILWLDFGFAVVLSVAAIFFAIRAVDEWFLRSALSVESWGEDGIFFGVDENGRRAVIPQDALSRHMHIIGASGFGKTTLLFHLLYQRIKTGRGFCFVDLKADVDVLEDLLLRVAAHNRLQDFKIFSLSRPELSCSYNPIARGSASEIKDKIMGMGEWSEVFYEKEAERFLSLILKAFVLIRDSEGKVFTLRDISECARQELSFQILMESLPAGQEILKFDLEELNTHLRKRDGLKNLHGLLSEIDLLLNSEFGPLLESPMGRRIDLLEAALNQEMIYFLMDVRRFDKTAERLGRVILKDLSTVAGEIGDKVAESERQDFLVIVDEFSQLATPQFVRFLQTARSSRMAVVISHQEISDLSFIHASMPASIMQNTATTVAFLQKMPDSAELIAGFVGTETTETMTRRVKDSGFGWGEVGEGTITDAEEYVIHPNELKNLNVGECFWIQKFPEQRSHKVYVSKCGQPERPQNLEDLIERWRSLLEEGRVFISLDLRARRMQRLSSISESQSKGRSSSTSVNWFPIETSVDESDKPKEF